VSGLRGTSPVVVQGCGTNAPVDDHGDYFAYVDPGPCTLFAVRRDGHLNVRSQPVSLDLAPSDDRVVDLFLPDHVASGIDATLHHTDTGPVVASLVDGGAARQAGLREGDRLLAIDHEAVDDLDGWQVLDRIQGHAGSKVRLDVLRDDVPLTVDITRP